MHTYWHDHKLTIIISVLALVLILFIVFELAWLRYNGTAVPRPTIPRGVQQAGNGQPLRFVVMGDSTSISQGSAYDKGYAVAAAQYLAKQYSVSWINVGVSGARAADVASQQLPKAVAFRPDLALIAVGANDITHRTSIGTVEQSLMNTITALRKANPAVRIIVTGSPDMGSPRRLPQPLRWLAGERTKDMNAMVGRLVAEQHLTLAPIAAKTGPAFRKDPSLFAADNFHPNAAGYALWNPVVVAAIQSSLEQ